jgi:putative FmdB family regulatory protein
MPIYEYRCEACGGSFEKLVPSHRAPMPDCPGCGSNRTRKMISRIGGILSGSARRSSCPESSACPASSRACADGNCPGLGG